MIELSALLKKVTVRHHDTHGITICLVTNADRGITLAEELLEEVITKKTILYLSGGNTPKPLYEKIAQKEQLVPAGVGIIDERFGSKWHDKSNELMIQQTGLLRYLQWRDIPFYPILQNTSREETADRYDEKVRELNMRFQQSVGILGIGDDGHTSSIIPNRPDFQNPWFDSSQAHMLVSSFNDQNSQYKQRIGMTFLGLAMLDLLIVLVFGPAKQKALEKIFDDGSEEEIPARFFKRPDIAKKTLFITGQTV